MLFRSVFYPLLRYRTYRLKSQPLFFEKILKEKKNMDMSMIADWFTIAFFLWYGLKKFVPALDKGFFSTLGGVIALAAAVFTFLSP